MKAQLLHLSGPYRGRTITYDDPRILMGSTSKATIRFPHGLSVVERHAELTFVPEGCSFYLRALDGDVFVNRRQIEEVILAPEDLIELGVDGPKMRFRIHTADGPRCKPIRQMLSDAEQVRRTGGWIASTHLLRHDLLTQSTWQRRGWLLVVVIMLAMGSAYLGGWLGGTRIVKKQQARSFEEIDDLQEVLDSVQAQVESFRHEQAGLVSVKEMEQLRADLERRARVVDDLLERNAALKRVLDVYTRGVCLIYGAYTFTAHLDEEVVMVHTGDGAPLHIEYMGTGFLATAQGHVITNRHVIEPWWRDLDVVPLLEQGLIPEFVKLLVVFPDRPPIEADLATIQVSTDNVDVAVFQVSVNDVPVLPLFRGDPSTLRGEGIILLGYPTGLNAILARAEPDVISDVISSATNTPELISELARRGRILPVITQGALNEVWDRRLVYDAETTSGGSGGPVFGGNGEVIGVNFAVTSDFDGSNFGIPIRFARRLLPPDE